METSWPSTPNRGPAVDEAAIARFEATIGARLPDDYRAYLAEVNGGRPVKARRAFVIGRGRSVINCLHSLDHPDDLFDLGEANEILRDALPPELIAIGADDGGATVCLCVKGEHAGEVWYRDTIDPRSDGANPRVLWHDRRDMTKLADTFRAFMAALEPVA